MQTIKKPLMTEVFSERSLLSQGGGGSRSGLVPAMLLRSCTTDSSSKDHILFPGERYPVCHIRFTDGAAMTASVALHARNPVVNFSCLISGHERIRGRFGARLPGRRGWGCGTALPLFCRGCEASKVLVLPVLVSEPGGRVNARHLGGFDSRHLKSDLNLTVLLLGSCPKSPDVGWDGGAF